MGEGISKFKHSDLKKDVAEFQEKVSLMIDEIKQKYSYQVLVLIDEDGTSFIPNAEFVEMDTV